jgi:beta-glucanase (GH16 family)
MWSADYKEPNKLNTCIHHHYDFNEKLGMSHTFANFNYTDWHTYAIEWNANRIIWHLDGKAIRTMSNHGIVDRIRIILSTGMDKKLSPTFAEYMYVDYVKVYQLKCDKNTPLTINNLTDLANYDNKVKKSITINPVTIPAGSSITLRANDFIELKPGFEVKTGRELYLDVSPCEFTINSVPIGGGEQLDD